MERPYVAGDVVSGVVLYKICPSKERLQMVCVVFKGQCNTSVKEHSANSSVAVREKVVIFRRELVPFQGPSDMQPQKCVWPFSFTFAKCSVPNRDFRRVRSG